jgi:hypothetical protein
VKRSQHSNPVWFVLVAMLAGASLACRDEADPHALTDSAALADTSAYDGIDYELTSDNYRRWLVANELLDSAAITPAARLSTIAPDDDEIDAVVGAMEDDARARAALDSADISAEDYVLTTIALAQSWDAVNRPGTVANAPAANVAFLRSEASSGTGVVRRPTSRYVDDDRPRRRGKGKAKGRNRGRDKRGKG